MKILIIILLGIFTQISFAQKAEKCIDQMNRVANALKMKGMVLNAHQDEKQKNLKEGEFLSSRIDLNKDLGSEKNCSLVGPDFQKDFEEGKAFRSKIKSMLVREFATKKKISADIYNSLFLDNTKKEISEDELCADMQKEIKNLDACSSDTFLAGSALQIDSLNGNFADSCKKLLPAIVASERKSQECDEARVKARAPREEITEDQPRPKKEVSGSPAFNRPHQRKVETPTEGKIRFSGAAATGQ